MKWFKKAAPYLLTAALTVAAIVTFVEIRDGGGESPDAFEPPIPPVEFLYLDGARVLKFLAALEGGEVGPIAQISKEITSVKSGVTHAGIEVGASSQRETAAESTLTRTESSALSLLLSSLEESDQEVVRYHTVTLRKTADLAELEEGMLVRFVTHHLLSPGYIRPYVVVRQSATLAALFPQAAGSEADAANSEEQRRRAESFVKQVGPDPRLTFAVAPPSKEGEEPLKVLLPMRYRGLTQERSLLEKGRDEYTGGRLEIVGKVIRVFREPTVGPCPSYPCALGSQPEYTDWATREIWRNPLEQASNYLIDHVSHSCEMARFPAEAENYLRRGQTPPPLSGRPCFLRKLRYQTDIYAPGAVILPIAIYK